MPSTKELRRRITSVRNTQQTTKAMKMVSAAKLRRAQDAIINQRPYAYRLGQLIREVLAMAGDQAVESVLLRAAYELETETLNQNKKALLVVVTSDRGLCGGFNSGIIKATQKWLMSHRTNYPAGVELAFVGRRGFDFFKTKGVTVAANLSEYGGKIVFQKAQALTESVINLFKTKGFSDVYFVYNEFKNAISQKVVVEHFLPLCADEAQVTGGISGVAREAILPASREGGLKLIKPSPTELLEALLEKHFSMQAFRILLESQAGEHGARMSAMESATKNAQEMIKKLTLQYNKQRQAGITKELLEIIAGSESQKGA